MALAVGAWWGRPTACDLVESAVRLENADGTGLHKAAGPGAGAE